MRTMIGVMVLVCGLAGGVSAQDAPPTPKQTDPKPADKPAQPGAPRAPRAPRAPVAKPGDTKGAKKAAPFWGPWVTREDGREMMVQARLNVRSDSPKQKETFRDPVTGKSVQMPKVVPFNFEALSVVWPCILNTANADLLGETKPWPEGSIGEVGYKGRLTVADILVDDEPTIVENNYPCGTRIGSWQAPKEAIERVRAQATGGGIREVTLTLEYPVRCYKVEFDEDEAMKVGWPAEWPADAASTFASQMWIDKGVTEEGKTADYDREKIKEILNRYLKEEGIDDAKSVPPVRLAKILTSKVWRDVAPTAGTGVKDTSRIAGFEGFALRAPFITFVDKKGSPHDMVVALVALMREAGLPTRLVIGLDSGSNGGPFSNSQGKSSLRSWAEFALYDETNNAMCWVPIDILKLRSTSNKPQKLTAKWRYFGDNDEFNQVAPLAFHFVPPADGVVTYGTPELWGWMVFPKAPDAAEASVVFTTAGVPKKASLELKEVSPLKVGPVEKK